MSLEHTEYGAVYITRRKDYTAVTKVISVKLPVRLIEVIDELIREGYFQNRSDAVREAVRRLIVAYEREGRLMLGWSRR